MGVNGKLTILIKSCYKENPREFSINGYPYNIDTGDLKYLKFLNCQFIYLIYTVWTDKQVKPFKYLNKNSNH